jgi:hypothetical protein
VNPVSHRLRQEKTIMTSKGLLSIAGLAAFVGYCLHRGQRAKAAKTEVKEDLKRWEGEGGNVPSVETPAPLPQPSYPGSDSYARH